MAPVVVFLVALPWIWRRRPTLLGPLAPLLLAMAGVGVVCLLFLSYEFFSTTERYEVDYTTLFLLGALAAWLALSREARGHRRRLIRVGGGVLAVWSCVTGIAISCQELQKQPGTFRALVNVTSPLSSAIAAVAGKPVLAEVYTPDLQRSPPSYSNLGTETTGFWLTAAGQAQLTIVSPDSRRAALVADVSAGPALATGTAPAALISGPGTTSYSRQLPADGEEVRIPIDLSRGVNRLSISPAIAGVSSGYTEEYEPESQALMLFTHLHLGGST
jgi:hypothetical protein